MILISLIGISISTLYNPESVIYTIAGLFFMGLGLISIPYIYELDRNFNKSLFFVYSQIFIIAIQQISYFNFYGIISIGILLLLFVHIKRRFQEILIRLKTQPLVF